MTNRKRWSRAAIALTFSVMTILGATACYAWMQQERAKDEARRVYAAAPNYTAQSNGSGLSLQEAPAQASNSLTPNASGSVSFARVVRNSLPMEQHALVSLVLSTQKNINSERKTEARNQLKRLVEQELDGRFASQTAELSLLEKRITEAKEKLAQRVARKNEIVERRMAELLAEPDDLAWNADINVQNANDLLPRTLPALPVQPYNSLQSNTDNNPTLQPAPYNANHPVGPAASPGNGTPLNFSVPMSLPASGAINALPEPILPASAPEPELPLDEPGTATTIPNDFAKLFEEAIDFESEFEELDGLTPEGKIEAVQRLTLRKRLRKLELGLEAVMKRTENEERSKALGLELANKEFSFAKTKLLTLQPLKGISISHIEYKQQETEVEIARHKAAKLQQELNDLKDESKEALQRVQTLRKKMDDILEIQKPAPEVENLGGSFDN